jgi:hypothetical protein
MQVFSTAFFAAFAGLFSVQLTYAAALAPRQIEPVPCAYFLKIVLW